MRPHRPRAVAAPARDPVDEPAGGHWPGRGGTSSAGRGRPRSAPCSWWWPSSAAPRSGWPGRPSQLRRRGPVSRRPPDRCGGAGRARPAPRPGGDRPPRSTSCFPVVSLNSLAGQEGFASDVEFGRADQGHRPLRQADQRRRAGSTAGRSTRSSPPSIRPASPTMRALCKTWTEGSPAAFAVLDGLGRLDRRQPALHHPGGPHPVHRPVDHGHQLDGPGLALPVVDRSRPGGDPPGGGQLGARAPICSAGRSRWGSSPATGPRTRSPSTTTSCPTCAGPASPRWWRPSTPTPPTRPPPTAEAPLVVQQLRSAGVDLGHPPHPVQRLLPGAPGRDRPAATSRSSC